MRIAVAGATGEVGRMMTKVLQETGIFPDEIAFLASSRSAGQEIAFDGRIHTVRELTDEALEEGFDYVLFSAGGSVSKRFAPVAADAGAVVIDNSSAFRMDESIPLVVPEINGGLLKGYRGIVANPNCSTIQMVLSLYRIHERFGLRSIVVSTYQAVSGAGRKGINELADQEEGVIAPSVFVRQIHRNVVPQIGDILDDGFSTEEMKMVNETRKILRDPYISVWPTTIRVPVEYGHSEAVFAETRNPFTMEDLRKAVEESEDVVLTDEMISPVEVAGTDITYVSRLRSFDNERFLMWNIADNIRVGAATNAVRILKMHMEVNTETEECRDNKVA